MRRYAVFGSPIAHSLSPFIHAAFARQTGIALEYVAIEAGHGDFAEKLAASGVDGANVTLPLKEDAFALCRSTSARAQRAGAVNTLLHEGDGWRGDNTDGLGLVRDLTERHGLDLRDRRVLLLGAGGAARGVAPALLDAGIHSLYIANRTAERADALADALGDPARVHPRGWDALSDLGEFDLLVNATAATRTGALPVLPMALVAPRSVAVDLNYGASAVAFLAWARAAGCAQALDGLGMLVEQAAESFSLWHGVRPETDAVYAALRARVETSPAAGD
ncbi:shikimate dehydrogenase [Thermomonas haemolytica]|uniref:Shikimate dehydrogenase (NADP(+)) n=1 Tax=Thermomonas haemolytica TaxID=141949 RepID=A0A4R3N0V0_9GAMM|nr:shikimate dehydrogenase [Thermomonas haemolytica]TCT21651.1 shikimate dehydrogenase [Thermomonas haemolytica]TNY30222.1 shikimate dehydrogenase [Thermomonas haemolytica]